MQLLRGASFVSASDVAHITAMQCALAIDVGSSSLRSALVDTNGDALPGSQAHVSIEFTVEEGGLAQLDPVWLRHAVENAIDRTLAAPGAAATAEIVVVGKSTFWHSLVALDSRGVPSTPVLTWADTRAEAEALELRELLDADAVHQRTGCILHPSYLPAKLMWLRRHQPEIFEQGASFVSFAQYCCGVWLGSTNPSASMASGSGLLDIAACDWDEELLNVLALQPTALGQVTPAPELLPPIGSEWERRWPRLRGVPWRAALGDGAASNIGAGCVSPNRLALMVGTSGALRLCERDRAGEPIAPGLWRYRLDRDHTLTGGALSDGGSAHAWLRATLALPDEETVERELLRRTPGEHGLVVLPFWSGERSTGWVGDATAVVAGLRRHTSALDIYHACIEAISFRFARVFDCLRREGDSDKLIVATGGGLLASPAWLQIMADVIGNPVVASGVGEASLRGAALLALRDVGALSAERFAQAPDGAAYTPRSERYADYLAERARQEELYQREVGPSGARLLARQTR